MDENDGENRDVCEEDLLGRSGCCKQKRGNQIVLSAHACNVGWEQSTSSSGTGENTGQLHHIQNVQIRNWEDQVDACERFGTKQDFSNPWITMQTRWVLIAEPTWQIGRRPSRSRCGNYHCILRVWTGLLNTTELSVEAKQHSIVIHTERWRCSRVYWTILASHDGMANATRSISRETWPVRVRRFRWVVHPMLGSASEEREVKR